MKKFINSYFGKFVSATVFAMVLWPLLDMFINPAFQYSVVDHVVTPILFGGFYTLFSLLIDRHTAHKKALASND